MQIVLRSLKSCALFAWGVVVSSVHCASRRAIYNQSNRGDHSRLVYSRAITASLTSRAVLPARLPLLHVLKERQLAPMSPYMQLSKHTRGVHEHMVESPISDATTVRGAED
jgi:hypothetical protein